MTTLTLDKLMKKYVETEKVATMDLGLVPPSMQPGWSMRKGDAKEELEKIKAQVVEAVKSGAFAVFLQGDEGAVKIFSEFCAAEANTINIAADEFYSNLTDIINPSIGDRRTFAITQLGLLIRSLDDVGRELKARNVPIPQIDDLVHVPTRDDLLQYVRRLVRSTGKGDLLNGAWIERQTVKKALEIRYSRSVVPVIITGATPEEVATLEKTLFSGTSFVVQVNKENCDSDSVFKCLSEIKKKLKTQKTN